MKDTKEEEDHTANNVSNCRYVGIQSTQLLSFGRSNGRGNTNKRSKIRQQLCG